MYLLYIFHISTLNQHLFIVWPSLWYCFVIKGTATIFRFLSATFHYGDVIMSVMASQITSLTIVYSSVYSDTDKKKTSKLHVTGLCEGNSPVTGEFPAQRASNTENVSI